MIIQMVIMEFGRSAMLDAEAAVRTENRWMVIASIF